MADEIWIRCEGSGCPPTTGMGNGSEAMGMCAMCGRWHSLINYVMPEHARDDIIARIARGDFDPSAVAGASTPTDWEEEGRKAAAEGLTADQAAERFGKLRAGSATPTLENDDG